MIEPKLCFQKNQYAVNLSFFQAKVSVLSIRTSSSIELGARSPEENTTELPPVNQDAIRYLAHCAKFSSKSVTKFLTFSTNLALAVDVGVTTFASTDSNVFHFFSLPWFDIDFEYRIYIIHQHYIFQP